jgi:hypothetical protein
MERPAAWECVLWQRIKAALEAAGRVHGSYYRMAEEAVRLCAVPDGQ